MTEILPFPVAPQKFRVNLKTGLVEHGPYEIDAEVIGDGRAGDMLVFWNERGACVHGTIVNMWPVNDQPAERL